MVGSEGSELMQLLKEAGLTQKQFGDALGVSEQTVRNWVAGRVKPALSIGQVKTIVRITGKSLEELPDDFGPVHKEE
jgi:putative transcriptional regulator